jgi:hypothetical protein
MKRAARPAARKINVTKRLLAATNTMAPKSDPELELVLQVPLPVMVVTPLSTVVVQLPVLCGAMIAIPQIAPTREPARAVQPVHVGTPIFMGPPPPPAEIAASPDALTGSGHHDPTRCGY